MIARPTRALRVSASAIARAFAFVCACAFVVASAVIAPAAAQPAADRPAADGSATASRLATDGVTTDRAAAADDRDADRASVDRAHDTAQLVARQEPPRVPMRREPLFSIGAHMLFGRLSQTASESFTAVLGASSGQVFGGGAELTFRSGIFVRGDVSYFGGDGERVEIIDGEVVPLGIPLSVSLTPIEFSGGYRFRPYLLGQRGQVRLVPFVGAGVGVVRYHEETDEEHPEENVSDRFTSYHVLAGLDVPLGRRVAAGAEVTRRWVPDGLGSGGVSQALGEDDLGGSTVRVRVRIIF